MSLDNLLAEAKKRVEGLGVQIQVSAQTYNAKDNELKQHLANHNVLIGQHQEAEIAVTKIEDAIKGQEVPPAPPALPENPEKEDKKAK